ncbi:hypothetical protein LA5095_02978 [Roseibium album]|uniref:Uncharacterized protein n=1 Tax=Roseibium album TaxID=311410 RepID=A0A0M7AHP2_9HYPH|nr:hypothetical protein LA5094_01924 [Roseibium album]CTQ64340.1 hypothetical protein LA5096_00347 [Roseibium album]CTQ74111.1 hypothetical protein LA5095_02978 [Roseibium album]
MNRTRNENADFIPVFLAKAGALGERAARAMCPNGCRFPLASKSERNVITLHKLQHSLFNEVQIPDRRSDHEQSGSSDSGGDKHVETSGMADES